MLNAVNEKDQFFQTKLRTCDNEFHEPSFPCRNRKDPSPFLIVHAPSITDDLPFHNPPLYYDPFLYCILGEASSPFLLLHPSLQLSTGKYTRSSM